ncbi:MAG: RNA polymerase sigma factor [Ruminococcus sp.]|nr:RNA polymerase sigma factor [Ruminococcus sp.]
MTNKELQNYVSKMQVGDKQAFSQIYNELKLPVFTIVYRIVKSKETAEDLTQEIFLKLYKSSKIHAKNYRAYVFTMARNLAIDTLRKEKKQSIENIDTEDRVNTTNIELKIDIEDAISSLQVIEREILTLHLSVGLKFNEIASIVNLSLPATYRRYKKALRTLKTILNGGAL